MRGHGGASLIYQNPALEGMAAADQIQGQRIGNDLNQMQLEELMRTRDAEHAVDQATRDYIASMGGGAPGGAGQPASLNAVSPQLHSGPQGQAYLPGATAGGMRQGQMPVPADGPGAPAPAAGMTTPQGPVAAGMPANLAQAIPAGTMPKSQARVAASIDRIALAKRLAAVEGGGGAAMQQLEAGQAEDAASGKATREEHNHYVDNFFKALGNGDVYSAQYWGGQAGMDVPDDVLANTEFQGFAKQVSTFKSYYGTDLEGFHDFFQDALKLKEAGDPNALQKAYRANTPTVRGPKNPYSDKLGAVDALIKRGVSKDQAYAMVFPGGGRGANGGSGGVWDRKHSLWLKLHPGDDQGAMNYADGKTGLSRKEAATLAVGLAKAEMAENGPGLPDGMTVDQRIDDLTKKLMRNDDSALDGLPDPAAEGGDIASQMEVPDETAPYEAAIGDRTIRSNDGQTWYYADTNEMVE